MTYSSPDGYYNSSDDNAYYDNDNNGYYDNNDNGYYDNDDSEDDMNGYDGMSEDYESEGSNDNQNSRYVSNVSKDQFDTLISDYQSFALKSKSSVMRNSSRVFKIRKHMERVFTRDSILLCFDIEAWERDHSKITEIGIAIYDPRDQELALMPHIRRMHIIVKENQHLRNGSFVPDNRLKFSGGSSLIYTLDETRDFVQHVLEHYFFSNLGLGCSIVGHALKGDFEWLSLLGVSVPGNARELDTQALFACTHGYQNASLKVALDAVHQPYAFLHNAGNDAYFTLLLAMKLCDPCVRNLSGIDCTPEEGGLRNDPQSRFYELVNC